ncbi:MAG: carbonic anhydrase [Acidimicrobiales bacterium]
MNRLLHGVARFQRDVFPNLPPRSSSAGTPQRPLALFVTCADSRVVPEVITQTDPGDLFGCQVVGNIVPAHGSTYGGVSATVEYAVSVLGVPEVIICGHTDCGAMKVLLDPSPLASLPSVQEWLDHAEAARRTVMDNQPGPMSDAELLDALTCQNVVSQLTNLRTHPAIASRVAGGKLRLHGWVYAIDTGEVRCYDEGTGRFVPASSLLATDDT